MSKPQRPELHRSGRGATDPASAKTRADVAGRAPGGDDDGRVPEENLPGHHPDHEQDKPEPAAGS